MLSLSKILLLVLVVLAVFTGARLARVFGQRRETIRREDRREPRHVPRRRRAAREVADADRCARCGSFVVPGAGPCGRADCPIG
ncbi:hypothetical protein P7L75_12175 [Tistrella mobilis]|uniref:hypothetical protein n=1 Tax=Tistrella mobilis TaxID=171437 RepID=UPI00355918E0